MANADHTVIIDVEYVVESLDGLAEALVMVSLPGQLDGGIWELAPQFVSLDTWICKERLYRGWGHRNAGRREGRIRLRAKTPQKLQVLVDDTVQGYLAALAQLRACPRDKVEEQPRTWRREYVLCPQ